MEKTTNTRRKRGSWALGTSNTTRNTAHPTSAFICVHSSRRSTAKADVRFKYGFRHSPPSTRYKIKITKRTHFRCHSPAATPDPRPSTLVTCAFSDLFKPLRGVDHP